MNPVNQTIKRVSGMWPVPGTAASPSENTIYRVLVGAVKFPDATHRPLPGFSYAANIFNVFAAAGIDVHRNLKVTIVIYGVSVFGCITNALYAAKLGEENPNVLMASELRRAGVELLICGQMLHKNGIKKKDLLDEIAVTFSGAAALAEYQRRGYTLLPL